MQYNNPISAQHAPLLDALQRASVRTKYARELSGNVALAASHRELVRQLAEEVLGDAHDDRIEDAYYGFYDTGNRAVPVFPKEPGTPRWARDLHNFVI